MTRKTLLLCSLILLFLSTPAHAQLWTGIIDPSRAIDWSNAGVAGGIPNRTTICSSIVPYTGTAATINNAIAACPSGQVVSLRAGTFNLSTGITFGGKSNVTLRGAGPDQTILLFSGKDGCGGMSAVICIHGSSQVYNNGLPASNIVNWTAGYAQGTTVVTLSDTSRIQVGQYIILDQLDDSFDPHGVYSTFITSAAPYCQGTCAQGGGRPGRNLIEFKLVTAINGTQVTISPGLYWPNWRTGQMPQAWWWGTIAQTAVLDGVEALSVDNSASGAYSVIEFNNAVNGWVKNVRSVIGGVNHVMLFQAVHITVQDSYFYGVASGGGSTSYGIEPIQSADSLFVNNIFQLITAPYQMGNSLGNVFAYNYGIDVYYDGVHNLAAFYPTHEAASAMNLLEGNQSNGVTFDMSHGTADLITLFRNQLTGIQPGFSYTSYNQAIFDQSFMRFMNFVGNVLGTQGYHTNYESSIGPQGVLGSPDQSIYSLGWSGVEEQTVTPPGNDLIAITSSLRWGNFDYATNTVRWNSSEIPSGNAVPATHTLPASFFLSAKPTWWGTMPWPPIGPDVTGGDNDAQGRAYKLPANLCYLNVMHGPANGTGGPLTFNANTCYGNTVPAPVVPPKNLRVQ